MRSTAGPGCGCSTPARTTPRASRWRSGPDPGARLRRHPRRDLLERQRAREQVSLDQVAARLAQLLSDVIGLDALGDDMQPEVVPELDHRPDDRGVSVVGIHVADELAIDLELVQRQPRQVTQRGLALTEVVE